MSQSISKLKNWLGQIPPWLFSILCALAILWLTIAPHPLGEDEIPMFAGADKVAHALMFGGFTLCLLFDRQRRQHWKAPRLMQFLEAVCLGFIFGFITELLQSIMELGRTAEMTDLLADLAGSLVFALLYIPIARSLARP